METEKSKNLRETAKGEFEQQQFKQWEKRVDDSLSAELTPEQIAANKRILQAFHNFHSEKMYKSSVFTPFDEWLERQGICFFNDRFITVELQKFAPKVLASGSSNLCCGPQISREQYLESQIAGMKDYIDRLPSCIKKLKDEEPVFVLRGQDKTALKVMKYWLELNLQNLPVGKIIDTAEILGAMHDYEQTKQAD
jgi:hypothetical protein